MKNISFSTACISNVVNSVVLLLVLALIVVRGGAQTPVALQPFAQQVRQVETALAYLGQPLSQADHEAINQSIDDTD